MLNYTMLKSFCFGFAGKRPQTVSRSSSEQQYADAKCFLLVIVEFTADFKTVCGIKAVSLIQDKVQNIFYMYILSQSRDVGVRQTRQKTYSWSSPFRKQKNTGRREILTKSSHAWVFLFFQPKWFPCRTASNVLHHSQSNLVTVNMLFKVSAIFQQQLGHKKRNKKYERTNFAKSWDLTIWLNMH